MYTLCQEGECVGSMRCTAVYVYAVLFQPDVAFVRYSREHVRGGDVRGRAKRPGVARALQPVCGEAGHDERSKAGALIRGSPAAGANVFSIRSVMPRSSMNVGPLSLRCQHNVIGSKAREPTTFLR